MRLFKIVEAGNEKDKLLTLKEFIGSEQDPKFFIHFGSVDRVGINPKSKYATPNGVYSYPLIPGIFYQLINNALPFAQNQPYLHVISSNKKILNFDNYSSNDFDIDVGKLRALKLFPEDDVLLKAENNARIQTPAGKMWNVTRIAANDNPNKWNLILRSLGYSGIYDLEHGIIHPAEPTQCVILDTSNVIRVKTMINPYATNQIGEHDGSIQDRKHVEIISKKNNELKSAPKQDVLERLYNLKKDKSDFSNKGVMLDYDLISSNFTNDEIKFIINKLLSLKDRCIIRVLYFDIFSKLSQQDNLQNLIKEADYKDILKSIPIDILIKAIENIGMYGIYRVLSNLHFEDYHNEQLSKILLSIFEKNSVKYSNFDVESEIFNHRAPFDIFSKLNKLNSDIRTRIKDLIPLTYTSNNEKFFQKIGGPPGLSKDEKVIFIKDMYNKITQDERANFLRATSPIKT